MPIKNPKPVNKPRIKNVPSNKTLVLDRGSPHIRKIPVALQPYQKKNFYKSYN